MYRFGQEEVDAAARVLKSGQWFRYGDPKAGHLGEAFRFESEFARWMGAPHACYTCSGTSALMCCYAGLKMGPGDEVIIPGYTWIATAYAPLMMGIVPVLVDIDESLTVDPDAIERAITPRTKAIDPVHMVGLACDMDRVMAIARRHNVAVIEDACQAVGGRWSDGRKLGAIGDMGAYSFNFHKVISCGDGGAFVSNRRDAHERGMILHDGGFIFRPHAKDIEVEPYCGVNLRGNEILAAILRVQLGRLDGIVADLHANRRRILRHVADAEGVEPIPFNGGPDTGTGGYLGFRFGAEVTAREFVANFNVLAGGLAQAFLPIDSERHVYANWGPVLARRGWYDDRRDAFADPRNAAAPKYSPDMLPKTLQILKRTALVPVNPDWTPVQADRVAAAVRAAAAKRQRVELPAVREGSLAAR